MSNTRRVTFTLRRQLLDLQSLLTLKHVHDPDRIESGLFAKIDPASTFVDECCLLSEKLGALLMQIAENDCIRENQCAESHMISGVA